MNQDGCWRFAASSVEGTSHVRQDLPCQDSASVRVFATGGGEVLAVTVSDGAGSASRSDVGSELACFVAMEAVEVHLAEGRAVSGIDREVVLSWLTSVRRAIQERAETDGAAVRDYACTLLLAVVGDDGAAVAQLGDGAVVLSESDAWSWFHWPQHGEYQNTTNFVTTDDAADRLAFVFREGRIDEVAAFSDGIEDLVLHKATRTVHGPFFDRMMPAVRLSEEVGKDIKLSHLLSGYLRSQAVCDRTDDDKTLVLASRRPREPRPLPASD